MYSNVRAEEAAEEEQVLVIAVISDPDALRSQWPRKSSAFKGRNMKPYNAIWILSVWILDIGCYRLHGWSKLVQSRTQRTSSSSDNPSFKVRNSTKTLGAEIWQQAVLGLNGFCGHAMLQAPDLGIGWSSTNVFPTQPISAIMPKAAGCFLEWQWRMGRWRDWTLIRLGSQAFLHADSEKSLADSADWAELVEPVSNSEIFASRTCQLHMHHMLHSFIPQSQNITELCI